MHRPLPHAPRVVADNRQHYELLVEMVQRYAAQGDAERVLRAATLASAYACYAPTGLLGDGRLERAVVHAVRGGGAVTVDGDRHQGRVLHVLSEVYGTGGHTRLAWRWIDRDDRRSDVVLTNQRGPVPARLEEAARASGGELIDLLPTTPTLLARARALREHMDRADLVVLHVHQHDAVTLAAANLPGPRPPVIYENHGDLLFWLGVAGTDLLCDLRPEVHDLDVRLRDVPDERIAVLPMPVDALASASADDLRRKLGIGPDAVVALTVTDGWKVAPSWGRGMPPLVDRVLHWSPRLTYVLVGVPPDEEWARLAKRYPGRVHVVGRVPDPAPYLALADLFLESYPTRAGTTPLEAAMVGLPVVALVDLPEDSPVRPFQTSSPGLAGISVAPTPEKCAVAVRRLASDPELRRREGAEVQAAVSAVHDGPGWRSAVEALYERARSLPARDVDDLGERPVSDERYGAMLLSAVAPALTSPDPRSFVIPLGDLYDARMQGDLFALLHRDAGSSLTVRVAAGWERHPEWTTRLLELAGAHPRLRVSLPFAARDDVQGTQTSAFLTAVLAGIGQSPETCGDIRVEVARRHDTGPSIEEELPLLPEALERLQAVLGSPFWEGSRDLAAVGAPAR